jgi:squalene-hopene/tetraprenyl-beta-curcumene cyclase
MRTEPPQADVSADADRDIQPQQTRVDARPDLEQRLQDAVNRAAEYLLSLQAAEGYWLGELEADTTLESDYIVYLYVLERADSERIRKLANYVRRRQLPDGGWNIYVGGPAELNATIKGYVALRLAGDPADAEHMQRASQCARLLGGIERSNSYARFYLALAGALGWDAVPAMPPELILLPRWLPLNIYSMSSWTRGIVVPLTILYALKPRWPLNGRVRVEELFCGYPGPAQPIRQFEWDSAVVTWRNVFLLLDRVAGLYEKLPWKPFRRRAMARARKWLMDHLKRSEGLGAIYPAMMNAIFALLALGHSPDDPTAARQIGFLGDFEIEEDDTLRLQPCLSPVWDTAIAMTSLQEAGLPPHHTALVHAAEWLIDKQILGPGDWQVKNRHQEPGGWAFEFRNDFYPDVDDTAFVLMSLERVVHPDEDRMRQAIRRGRDWLLSMQNRDGGWAAFDRDNDCAILNRVPFADHNAMIDPSTADVTARVLEHLGGSGGTSSDRPVRRGIEFLKRDQTPEGAWYGRWGVNYVYGTSGVLRAAETLGVSKEDWCQRAASWLRNVQNPDGGWGESCVSYDDLSLKGQAESTASQTAWGLIGLLAAGGPADASVTRAVQYLLGRQQPDGSWKEAPFTGTGFPRVFYLKYHLYQNSFPLYALARYRNVMYGESCREIVSGRDLAAAAVRAHNGNGRLG